jgi:hypothetical protein
MNCIHPVCPLAPSYILSDLYHQLIAIQALNCDGAIASNAQHSTSKLDNLNLSRKSRTQSMLCFTTGFFYSRVPEHRL